MYMTSGIISIAFACKKFVHLYMNVQDACWHSLKTPHAPVHMVLREQMAQEQAWSGT